MIFNGHLPVVGKIAKCCSSIDIKALATIIAHGSVNNGARLHKEALVILYQRFFFFSICYLSSKRQYASLVNQHTVVFLVITFAALRSIRGSG